MAFFPFGFRDLVTLIYSQGRSSFHRTRRGRQGTSSALDLHKPSPGHCRGPGPVPFDLRTGGPSYCGVRSASSPTPSRGFYWETVTVVWESGKCVLRH